MTSKTDKNGETRFVGELIEIAKQRGKQEGIKEGRQEERERIIENIENRIYDIHNMIEKEKNKEEIKRMGYGMETLKKLILDLKKENKNKSGVKGECLRI